MRHAPNANNVPNNNYYFIFNYYMVNLRIGLNDALFITFINLFL